MPTKQAHSCNRGGKTKVVTGTGRSLRAAFIAPKMKGSTISELKKLMELLSIATNVGDYLQMVVSRHVQVGCSIGITAQKGTHALIPVGRVEVGRIHHRRVHTTDR